MVRGAVLVVEDNEEVRRSLCDFVAANFPDVSCMAVASGEEAVERVGANDVGLVLMDLGLPGISGVEATRRIGAVSPSTRVVVVSIHDTASHRAAAAAAGAIGYVPKSAFPTELRPVLGRYLTAGPQAVR